jgi:hypothetical protein
MRQVAEKKDYKNMAHRKIQDYVKNTFQIYITSFYHVIICVCFCINMRIYSWSCVKQLGKFKINLVYIII